MHVSIRVTLAVTGLALTAMPALAITKQQSPAPGPQRESIADPDERSERLAERTERAARQHRYDRTNARSVMEIGSRSPN